MAHPRQKFDRLLAPAATAAELRCDYAVAPYDAACRDAERVWGIDRLQELVTPELAARYGAAMAHLNECINEGDAAKVAAAAANCVKGLAAMDAEARKLGHAPAPADVLQFVHEGTRYGIMRRVEDWPPLAAAYPDLTLVSLIEVGNALALYRQGTALAAAHAAFPGAVVTASRPLSALEKELGDEIPW